jgi:hypothetical protein
MLYFPGVLEMSVGLLIRWSLVRVRPGEPPLASHASKTLSENGSITPVYRANS